MMFEDVYERVPKYSKTMTMDKMKNAINSRFADQDVRRDLSFENGKLFPIKTDKHVL